LECGYYARYLKLWKKWIEQGNMKIFIFEEDVVRSPERMLHSVYDFLSIDPHFLPKTKLFSSRMEGK